MDTSRKFDGRAKDYATSRPGYPPKLIDRFYGEYGITESSVVVDIGSGTGKFARYLIEKGSTVYCVEPNEDMRHAAEKELGEHPNFYSIPGTAENTTLADHFADCITAAQAFHWFDVQKFKQEASRILKNRGRVFFIWNIREKDAPLNRELYQIYSKYCPDFKGFSGGLEKDDPRIKTFFNDRYDYLSCENPLYFNLKTFIARSLSSSYSLKEGHRDYAAYMDALTSLFCRYADHHLVTIPNHSVAYIGTIE